MNKFIKEGISDTLTPKLTFEADQSQVQNQTAINKLDVLGWINNAFCHNFLFQNWIITGNKCAPPESLEETQGWNSGFIEPCVDKSIEWRTGKLAMWQAFMRKDQKIQFPVHLRVR